MRSRAIEEHKKRLRLTSEQREVLVGILLGDACLESQNAGRTYRLKIEQCDRRLAYVEHLHQLFADWVRTGPRRRTVRNRTGTESINWAFATLSHEAFRFYAHQFYGEHGKQVPKLIHKWLTPRALAYWFVDDGSAKSAQSKAVILNTQGFTRDDVKRLIEVLTSQFGFEAKERKQRDGWQIYISGRSYESFVETVDQYVIPGMREKLPLPRSRRTQLPKT